MNLELLQFAVSVMMYLSEMPGLQDDVSLMVAPSYAGHEVNPIWRAMCQR